MFELKRTIYTIQYDAWYQPILLASSQGSGLITDEVQVSHAVGCDLSHAIDGRDSIANNVAHTVP